MNSPRIPESIPEKTKPDFKTSFESGFFLAMKTSETGFCAVTSDGMYAFEFNIATPNEPKYVSELGESSDIAGIIDGYQERTILNCMHMGSYPLPEIIPKEYRKLVTTESISTYLSELIALEKTEEYKDRVQAIFDIWNQE
jgi:hypothetical protein